jgi:hypothetical protein
MENDSMTPLPRPALASLPLTVALTLALSFAASAQVASLVGPDETPAPEEETAGAVILEDREEALLAYAQCMRDNGVDMDDPQVGAGGGGRFFGLGGGDGQRQIDRFGEEFQTAQEACGPILEAARPEIDPAAEQERLEEQLALAQCIRDSGYPEYPDPAIGTDGRLQRGGGREMASLGFDPRSEEFREVASSCRDEIGLEEFGPGGGPGFGRGGN